MLNGITVSRLPVFFLLRIRGLESLRLFVTRLWLAALSCILLSCCLGLSQTAVAQNEFTGRVVGVEAGDRIKVRLDTWTVTVQLHGIVCPLASPEFVEKSRAYTTRRVDGTLVRVFVRGTGAKQTVYGEVMPETGGSLNEELVRVGLAIWARQYAPQRTHLGVLEQEAHASNRGVWGDSTGKNVSLPARAVAFSPRSHPTPHPNQKIPTPTPPPSEASLPKPSGPTQATQASPAPVIPLSSSTPAVATAITASKIGEPNSDVVAVVFAFTTGTALALLLKRYGFDRRRFLFQFMLALTAGGMFTLLAPLPLLLSQSGIRSVQLPGVLLAAVTTALAFAALFWAGRLGRRDRILRTIPQTSILDAVPGPVHLRGETSAPQGVIHSTVGGIHGIYIREVVCRYDPGQAKSKSQGMRGWVTLRDETRTADFLLTDETGTIGVDAARAMFHPLRVARFYNDIPVDTFFDRPYGGDIRIEVFFIPQSAEVSVWGRWYRSAAPDSSQVEERVGSDAGEMGLVIVEGREGRVYARRPWGLITGIGGAVCTGAALWFVSRGALAGATVAFAAGLFFPVGLMRLWRLVQKKQDAMEVAWEDAQAALAQRAARLPEMIRMFRSLLPEQTTLIRELELALAQIHTASDRQERLEAEQQASRVVSRLSASATVFLPTLSAHSPVAEMVSELSAEVREAEERERYLAEVRERYNEVAEALNGYRRSFPYGLLLRAFEPDAAPLFGSSSAA